MLSPQIRQRIAANKERALTLKRERLAKAAATPSSGNNGNTAMMEKASTDAEKASQDPFAMNAADDAVFNSVVDPPPSSLSKSQPKRLSFSNKRSEPSAISSPPPSGRSESSPCATGKAGAGGGKGRSAVKKGRHEPRIIEQ